VSAFAKLRRGPFAFLLESAPAGGETWSRYTFLGTEPRAAWRLTDGVVEDWSPSAGWHGRREPADPLADLQARVAAYRPADVAALGPFWSGAVGFFSYDVVRHIERLPNAPPRGIPAPDALFVFTRALVVMDNLRAQARVVVGVPVDGALAADEASLRAAYDDAVRTITETMARLRAPFRCRRSAGRAARPAVARAASGARTSWPVDRIKEYVRAGAAFQAPAAVATHPRAATTSTRRRSTARCGR
jgi:anthranilate synthase component 1